MHIKNKKIPAFPKALKAKAKKSLKLAADWAVVNQVGDAWPNWDANKGRFPYHVLISPAKRKKEPLMLTTCWKTSRMVQGLYSAYGITKNKKHLAAANQGLAYVMNLQILDPFLKGFVGSFIEDSPLGRHIAIRDGVEAVQAFIQGYLVTRNKQYLERAELGTEWFFKHFNSKNFPAGIAWPWKNTYNPIGDDMAWCIRAGAMIFCQMYAITGKKAYITRGAAPMIDVILKKNILPSGGFGIPHSRARKGSHHLSVAPELRGVLANDDGIGVALLCVYKTTGKKKYLDAAIRMADFWVDIKADPEQLAAFASIALFLSDVCRITGDDKYLPLIKNYIEKTISLQCKKKDPLLFGCYMGEDMATHYDKETKPLDYIDARITSYALIALSKIAARTAKDWPCAYSAFGW